MSNFEEWLKTKEFNRDRDVLVVNSTVTLKDATVKVIKIKSFNGVAVIKSHGYF